MGPPLRGVTAHRGCGIRCRGLRSIDILNRRPSACVSLVLFGRRGSIEQLWSCKLAQRACFAEAAASGDQFKFPPRQPWDRPAPAVPRRACLRQRRWEVSGPGACVHARALCRRIFSDCAMRKIVLWRSSDDVQGTPCLCSRRSSGHLTPSPQRLLTDPRRCICRGLRASDTGDDAVSSPRPRNLLRGKARWRQARAAQRGPKTRNQQKHSPLCSSGRGSHF